MLRSICQSVRICGFGAMALVALLSLEQPSSAQINTFLLHLQIQTADSPTLRFRQLPLVVGEEKEYTWDLTGNDDAFVLADETADTEPIVVQAGAGNNVLYVARGPAGDPGLGDLGIGTTTPRVVAAPGGHPLVGGRVLNLKAAVGTARFVVEGKDQAETYIVHSGGPANQRILRSRLINGVYFISTVPDTASANIEPYIFAIKLANGNVGIRTPNPQHPLQVGFAGNGQGNGAHVTAGGVWLNASSRTVKKDIEQITSDQARQTVRALEPVSYRYNGESEESYAGFIAEDVPDLVATQDRKSLSPMDIVAVLTKFVQDQDQQLTEQRTAYAEQQKLIEKQQQLLESLQQRLDRLEKR